LTSSAEDASPMSLQSLHLNLSHGFFVWYPRSGLIRRLAKTGIEVTYNNDSYLVKYWGFGFLYTARRVDKHSALKAWPHSPVATLNIVDFLPPSKTTGV
jgi:hypothetical protein